jgi:ATP-dependent helicase/nuclease subunit B
MVILPGRLAGEVLAQSGRGTAGLHRNTLIQWAATLARSLMAERGLGPLGALGLEAVAARVVDGARQDRELTYFAPVASLPGFARALAKTLGELRLAGVTPDGLTSQRGPRADLSLFLARYQSELAARSLADMAAIFTLACEEVVKGRGPVTGLPMLLLDVPLETRAHRELFAKLAAQAPEVLALVTSEESAAEAILGVPAEDLDIEIPATPIEHLRRYVFSRDPRASPSQAGFEIFSAPGEGLEAVEIARRILHLATEGITFDQVAILLRNPERYQPVIEEALRRASIPAYFSRGTVRPDPAGRAFLALLACAAEKLPASRFAEYLSLGQVPESTSEHWVGPDDDLLAAPFTEADEPNPTAERKINAPWGWEKLLVDAAVIGGKDRWERRLKGLEREFALRLESLGDKDEEQRSRLATQIERLQSLAQFALPLIEKLNELPASASWAQWLEALAFLAQTALRQPDGVLAVLAEFEPMGEVGPVTVEEVAEVLSDRLRFLRAEPPQRRWGRVFVASIEESRGCEFRAVFLPGLAEGLFPQRALEDPLLLDDFRSAVAEALPLRKHKNIQERERLHLAVAAARERFIASYPRMNVAEARPRVPSFYALELPRALAGALPQLKDFEAQARDAAPARLNWPAPPETSQAIDDAEYDLAVLAGALKKQAGARYLVEANPHLARSLRSRWSRWRPAWKEADGLVTHDAAALAALGEHRLSARAWSPSSLEQFAVCPYKFALHGIHRLRPREEAAPLQYLDPLTRGALFHEVQCALLGELRTSGLLPLVDTRDAPRLPEALAAADRTLERIAERYAEDLAPAIPRVWKTEIEDLRTNLRGWLQQVAQNDSDWDPLYFEFAFGLAARDGRDPASTTEEATLAEGVRLRGSIDLVEKNPRTGALRITDHKTGKPPERIPAYTGGGRVLQPLLYALASEQLLKKNVESGRLFYATQRGGYQQIVIQITPSARRFLAKLLQDVDEAIATGFLPPVPEKDACRTCDYRTVCGPYEEQRAGRYKDRRDERLDGLNEIRGFL